MPSSPASLALPSKIVIVVVVVVVAFVVVFRKKWLGFKGFIVGSYHTLIQIACLLAHVFQDLSGVSSNTSSWSMD